VPNIPPIPWLNICFGSSSVCGIAGIVSAADWSVEPTLLGRMIGAIGHRGPDDSAVHIEPFAGLAHARLSIIDIAGGAQPMSNEDGTLWITFNGEIYNYLELRERLEAQGHRFRTRSDTEVLLRLYEEEGAAALERLNGQWAFGIWDTRMRSLFLSRDRVGTRPLFYTACGRDLLFASEIKALFANPEVSRELDPKGLDDIFTFWTTRPPATAFREVRELPPGHSLTWRDGQTEITEYWRPTARPLPPARTSAASTR